MIMAITKGRNKVTQTPTAMIGASGMPFASDVTGKERGKYWSREKLPLDCTLVCQNIGHIIS